MKPDEILIAKTSPGLTEEPKWWRFCVKNDGRFEYEKSWWSEKAGENTDTASGRLNEETLVQLKKIITTLDEVELDGFIDEDAGSSIIDYRRADNSTGSVEQYVEVVEDEEKMDVFDLAWSSITKIVADHI